MLFDEQVRERFFYALEFGIESAIVELYLLDNRGALDVVMICVKF